MVEIIIKTLSINKKKRNFRFIQKVSENSIVRAFLEELNKLNAEDVFETNEEKCNDFGTDSVTKLENKIKRYEKDCNNVHNYE